MADAGLTHRRPKGGEFHLLGRPLSFLLIQILNRSMKNNLALASAVPKSGILILNLKGLLGTFALVSSYLINIEVCVNLKILGRLDVIKVTTGFPGVYSYYKKVLFPALMLSSSYLPKQITFEVSENEKREWN